MMQEKLNALPFILGSFAGTGDDFRKIEEFIDNKNVKITMIYTYILNKLAIRG